MTITSPVQGQVFPRDAGGSGVVSVTVSSPVNNRSVEARHRGGAWVNYGNITGGTKTFNITGVNTTGYGDLEVRLLGGDTEDTHTNVAIGEVIHGTGQSNMSGRGTSNQTYSSPAADPNLFASLYGNDGVWKDLVDPWDDATGAVYTIANDAGAAGSYIPHIATAFLAGEEMPVAFVPSPRGNSPISAWTQNGFSTNPNTLYGSLVTRWQQTGGRFCLWHQGENDAGVTSAATYQAELESVANALNGHTGMVLIVCLLQNCTGIDSADLDEIRDGTTAAAAANPFIYMGPDLSDLVTDDTVHIQNNTNLAIAGQRWYTDGIAPLM